VIIAIVGSRDYTDYAHLSETIQELFELSNVDMIISGGARGADTLAEEFAKLNGIPVKVIPAKWNELGKSAGIIRNCQIVKESDVIVAFWDYSSRGTKHTIEECKRQNKEYYVVDTRSVI